MAFVMFGNVYQNSLRFSWVRNLKVPSDVNDLLSSFVASARDRSSAATVDG